VDVMEVVHEVLVLHDVEIGSIVLQDLVVVKMQIQDIIQ